MRHGVHRLIVAVVLLAASVRPAAAWGFDVHRFIVDRAIALLPPALRPFYEKHRLFVVEHSIDPDLWRLAGFAEEPARHFLNLDAYGAFPFATLPRDLDAAVKRFGRATVERNGLLPWRVEEIFDRLAAAFGPRADAGYALENVKFFTAVLAHYASDATQPLHGVVNYDGQLTGQHGVHARFETELFARFADRLTVRPAAPGPVRRPRDFIFDTLLKGFEQVDEVLAADRAAIAGRDAYDEAYFERFFREVRPVLEGRIAEAITAVASLVTTAWERAGRPDLPLEPPRLLRKVPRPAAP
jgi:hypothetical protein